MHCQTLAGLDDAQRQEARVLRQRLVGSENMERIGLELVEPGQDRLRAGRGERLREIAGALGEIGE